ncbi:acyltransferase family protein [Actinomadura decatromicini]|uniref:Acyltransferase family protein n=1 Tax=Actinomadura decatromicini TaxID=2604572 RepID=A0A5D3FZ89_9ACTN|nr:acyltransferase family protein [Actinomadura decatromicini]TYK53504.1 acyltransferase family protein [Actinomadura decatromicini]
MTDTLPPPRSPAAPAASGVGVAPGTEAAQAPPPAPGPRRRDPYFDNVKFFLILLVVVGHVWEVFRARSLAADAAYSVVYGFHMPVFVFVSGYFSRGFMRSTDKFRVIFPTLIVPYVIFNVLYRLQLVWLNGNDFRLHEIFRPQFLMWFLVALVLWRLSAPLWSHLRYPVAVSVALCLVAGSWSFNSDSTLCRAAALLPFFVLGLTVRPERVAALRSRPWTRYAGAALLVAALPVAYVWQRGDVVPKIEHGVLLWNRGYEHMGFGALEGMGYRLLALALAVVLGAAFLAAVPRGRAWYTELGTRTMYVYLLHGLVVKGLDYGGVLDADFYRTPLGLVSVTVGALALGTALATVPVQRLTRRVVEPDGRWLLRPAHRRT